MPTISTINDVIKELGVCISYLGNEDIKLELIDENAEHTLESAWEKIILLAQKGHELHVDCVGIIKFKNLKQYHLLNSVFINKIAKKDLPAHCKRCKKEEFTDEINLKGKYPTLVDTNSWFESSCGWSLQLTVSKPFYGFDPLDYLKLDFESPVMSIGDFMCPACTKEQTSLFMELIKD